ncbi:MAG TPA: DUF4215 domain-containing protein [Polyangiaceae bacterium]|nr:DUF4215 domain-containing protein [Polyangiaceae bacterium]
MRVLSMLGRPTAPFALWLSVAGSLVACGSRDQVIGGPFDGDDDAHAGGSTHRGGTSGHSGGSAGSSHSVGGGINTGGSSEGGSATGGTNEGGSANVSSGGDAGFGGTLAGAGGTSTGGDAGAFGGSSPNTGGVSGFGGSSTGGSGTGGTSAGGSATGGSATGGTSTGGTSAGGSTTGGTGGSATGGSSNGGSSNGGSSSGTGGSAMGGIGPLGDMCSPNGMLACHGPAQRLRTLCDGNVWKTNGSCVESENCDTRSGVCVAIIPECAGKQPTQRFCRSNTLGQCGPDLVTYAELEQCTGRCVETAGSADCAPEQCGDGRIQAGETCDDGNRDDTDTCTNRCTKASCGDGSLYAGLEKCDDGNATAGDGCSVVCGSDTVMVGTGYYGTCALGTSGQVSCWGYNQYGQQGAGDTQTRGSWIMDMGVNLPLVSFGSGRTAVALSVGYQSSCAILDDGSLKCWGYNAYGQLGIGDTAVRGTAPNHLGDNLPAVSLGTGRKALKVSVGSLHTCAILDDQSVKCWGYNYYGQLGQGDNQTRGDVAGELGDNLPPVELGTGAVPMAIATGYAHTCALLTSGQVKCWGSNSYGQLGLGDTVTRGDNPSEMGDSLPAVELGTGRTAVAIATGESYSCALLDSGEVKCWGYSSYGQLGLGDAVMRGDFPNEMGDNLPAVELGSGHTAKAIGAGTYATCALLDDNQVKCWGYNGYGTLGIGDTNTHGDGPNEMGNYLPTVNLGSGRSARAISVGAMHVCALLDNLALKCWGNNSYAQLGLGTGTSTGVGDGAGELGDNLPYVLVTF